MKPSILIVDDEILILKSLARLLSPDYTVYQASSGREALHVLEENKGIELVLSDIKMPEMGGIELLDKIRSDNRDTAVILMTAFYGDELLLSVKRKGAYDCLFKPLDLNELQTTLKNALRDRGLKSENLKQ